MTMRGVGRIVLDASVAAKYFFEEPGQQSAYEIIVGSEILLAPDLIVAEMTSIASKKVRRGEASPDAGRRAVLEIEGLINQLVPVAELAEPAFDLAVRHGFSDYDSFYLALAERQSALLATSDHKLVMRANACGLGDLILADWAP